MKIGIFGGSFDPPHVGHLIFAEQVRQKLNLDKFYFIPCATSPHLHKDVKIEVEHRLRMLELALADNEYCEVSDVELKRGGVSYTIDTIDYFLNKFPGVEIKLLIGSDLLDSFDTWKNYKEILKKVQVTVILRSKYEINKLEGFEYFTMPEIELSSSYIREEINAGRSVKYLVPETVKKYISENKLYQKGEQHGT